MKGGFALGRYARGACEGVAPREGLLREELRRRAEDEARAGADEVASVLRTLSERIDCRPAIRMIKLMTTARTGRRMKRALRFISWGSLDVQGSDP